MEKKEESLPISDYCNKVCEQIRWKKAKHFVFQEIDQHLSDQRDAYLTDGQDEKTATQQAIIQMGDPVMVGEELDKTHKPKAQGFLLLLVGIMILIGCISTYQVENFLGQSQRWYFFQYLFAYMVLLCCYHLDFTVLGKYPREIYGLVLLFSCYAFANAEGIIEKHLTVGQYHIPLSYFFFIFPLSFALFVYSMRGNGIRGLLYSMFAYIPLAYLLASVPSIPTFFSYSIVAFSILCLGISRNWFHISKKTGFFVLCIPSLLSTFHLAYTVLSHTNYLENGPPLFSYVHFGNVTEIQEIVREILKNTPFLGETSYDFTSIPVTFTPDGVNKLYFDVAFRLEFRLAYLVSQFGFAVLLLVVGIYTAMTLFSMIYSLKQRSILGTLVSFSIIATFLSQCAFSMVDSIGYGNFSGIPVPFLAHGQTSLLINSALIGFMLSVFRTGSVCTDQFEDRNWRQKITLPKIKGRLPTIKVSVTLPKKNG